MQKCPQLIDAMLKTYRLQIVVLPLIQAIVAIPELRNPDDRHDEDINRHHISCNQ